MKIRTLRSAIRAHGKAEARSTGREKLSPTMLLNVYATVRTPKRPAFPHVLRSYRDVTDRELFPHLQGFMGFVMANGERPMTSTRYHVLRHLERVRHQFAIEVEKAHMPGFEAWALEVNGLVFTTDTAVRAPDGKVLVSPETGDPEPGAVVPYPEDARHRKAITEAELAERGLHVPAILPPVVSELEVELREPAEVVARAFALFACAVRAESLAAKEPLAIADLERRLPLAFESLSHKEQEFFGGEPSPQDIANHAWRYEALAALTWALGIGGQGPLPFPSATVDVSALAETMLGLDGRKLLGEARLRPVPEILSALDHAYRLHWLTTEARLRPDVSAEGIEPGVVLERHYALSWLTRFEEAEWDDVSTPT